MPARQVREGTGMTDGVSVATLGAAAAWTPGEVWAQEAAFLAVVVAYLAWAQWRLPAGGPPSGGEDHE
jgi:hypothetical protein